MGIPIQKGYRLTTLSSSSTTQNISVDEGGLVLILALGVIVVEGLGFYLREIYLKGSQRACHEQAASEIVQVSGWEMMFGT